MSVPRQPKCGDAVRLVEIDRPAVIDGITVYASGEPQYRVVYWNDGRRYSEWVYSYEIRFDARGEVAE